MNLLPLIAPAMLLATLSAGAQTSTTSIRKVADGLYLMYYDITSEKPIVTKSTIVEFNDHIALLEMPISNDGAGSVNLKDHSEGGEKVLRALHDYFPGKPLKYVLSSHWHPHSISSILPFISRGITVITTRNNFKRLSEFVDASAVEKYGRYLQFVDGDSLVLGDAMNSIIAYRFTKEEYHHVPTEDFLYFYLPKYNYMHSSCMFQRLEGTNVGGKEMISSRVEDLNRFMLSKNIAPRYVITTDTYWDDGNGMASGDTLRAMFRDGVTMSALENEVMNMDESALVVKSDSIIKYLAENHVPYSILNNAVYSALSKHDLKKALALARLQALVNPSDPNVWDTFGEVYYFLGEIKLARKYETQSTRIDRNFKAGEQVWKKELEDFRKKWGSPH
ncbi:MAG: hypothetical protein JWQ98_3644 [Chlorobi bacterium]|nr:hypothetical protein [Chlorobiota bacterium]